MVVLNFYGKIEPICISEKLGLYIANLPSEEHDEWRGALANELELAVKADKIYQEKIGTNYPCGIINLYQTLFSDGALPEKFEQEHYIKIADLMICIYQNYDYTDMPLGGWDTNCFDGRLCEEDYSEKIIDFINFMAYSDQTGYAIPSPVPQWIFSSNHDEIDHCRIFWGGEEAAAYILALQEWGKLFDSFLCSRNDYLLFDYLVNTIHKDNEYNANHLVKAFSLCQLFLENRKESELDTKLPQFFEPLDPESDTKRQAELFRKMRNKIAHGDFLAFETVVETYAFEFMDGRFAFDYSEYSRKNWAVQHVCCELDNVIRKLLGMLLFNRRELERIKKSI